MPVSRSKKTTRSASGSVTFRKVKPAAKKNRQMAAPVSTAPVENNSKKKRRSAKQASKKAAPRKAHKKIEAEEIPGWDDLAGKKNRRKKDRTREVGFLEAIPTIRFALLILALAAAFTLYVGHVHATQALVSELQTLRRDNMQLHLKYNRLKGDFDRATGPSVIYERAHAMGLEEGITYGATLRVK